MTAYPIITGLILGSLGSFHCLGMCGPLALGLPIHHLNQNHKLIAILNYNLGRVLTYTTIGIFIGILGLGFSLLKLQQYISIIAGIISLIYIVTTYIFKVQFFKTNKVTQFVTSKIPLILSSHSVLGYLGLGLLNGLLPCGLVYAAAVAAFSTGTVFQSGLLMLCFGIGTAPMLLILSTFQLKFSPLIRSKINKIIPYTLLLISIVMIIRGLGLGIPYLSPESYGREIMCHGN